MTRQTLHDELLKRLKEKPFRAQRCVTSRHTPKLVAAFEKGDLITIPATRYFHTDNQ